MSFPVLFALLAAIAIYWFLTQILPERRKLSVLRPSLGEGLLAQVNERRHERGLPLLELDDGLVLVAENKAVHQVMTGRADEGWDYPSEYAGLLGQSLLLEALFTGSVNSIAERIARHRDIFDEEWLSCGIGVANTQTGQVVVALILCREAWEPATETGHQGALAKTIQA